MAALKNLVPDFKAHLASLSREEMLKLLTDLIDDADGLNPKGMYYVLRAEGAWLYSGDRAATGVH